MVTVKVKSEGPQRLEGVRVVDVTPEGFRRGFRSRTYRGKNVGGSFGSGGLGRAGEPDVVYTSDFLPGQTFNSIEARDAAVNAERQRQAEVRARVVAQDKALKEQRQSIVARGSGVDVAKDVPLPTGQAVVKQPERLSLRERLFIAREDARQQGIGSGIKTFVKTGTANKKIKQAEKLEREVQRRMKDVVPTRSDSIPIVPGSQIPGTTAQGVTYEDVSTDVLLSNAAQGSLIDLEVAQRRFQSQSEAEANVIAQRELTNDQKIIDRETAKAQARINSGESTIERETFNIQRIAQDLDKSRQQRVSNQIDPKIQERQRKLDKASTRGRISRLAISTGTSIAAGIIFTPAASALPRSAQIGLAGASGVGIAASGARLSLDTKKGDAGILEVAEFAVPLVGFGIGAKIGGYVKGKGISQPEIDTAFKNARLEKTGKPQVLTTEKQINSLKVSESQRTELINQLRMTGRAELQRFSLVNSNPKQQAVINKVIPKRSITAIQTSEVGPGGQITGQYIARVDVGRGLVRYVELQTGTSAGLVNKQTGRAVVDTLVTRTNLQEPRSAQDVYQDYFAGGRSPQLREATKIRQVSKTQEKLIRDAEGSVLGRTLNSETLGFTGETIRAKPGKQISEKDLLNLAESQQFKKFPSTKSSNEEFQKSIEKSISLQGKGRKAFVDQANVVTEGDLVLLEKRMKFSTVKEKSSTKNLDQPGLEFSKKTKPFESPAITQKADIPKPSKSASKTLKKVEDSLALDYQGGRAISEFYGTGQYELTAGGVTPPKQDFSSDILKAVKQGAQKVNARTSKSKNLVLSPGQVERELKKLQDKSRAGQIEVKDLLSKEFNKLSNRNASRATPKTKANQAQTAVQLPKMGQTQKLTLKQIEKAIQKLEVQPYKPLPPNLRTPDFNFPLPPLPSNREGGAGRSKKSLGKKRKKKKPSYAASLAAAAFQAQPIKVSKKDLERLKKQTFTGFETRPVLAVDFGGFS